MSWVRRGSTPVKPGQTWSWEKGGLRFELAVVAVLPCGEVVLRPKQGQNADAVFPAREVDLKGKTTVAHVGPFVWVEAGQAEAAKGSIQKLTAQRQTMKDPDKIRDLDRKLADLFPYEPGDLLANEAWSVWDDMSLFYEW